MSKDHIDYKKLIDEELIKLFQSEDIEAFNEIVIRYKDKLVNFIYRWTGNKDDSEDLAQDTFIKLFHSKHLYKEIAKFSTWLYTIAINISRTYLRKKKKFNRISISEYDVEEGKDYELVSPSSGPDEDANSKIENEYIQRALNLLKEPYKTVIILRDIENFEYEEIAIIIDLPLGTVKSRINRGREKLKKILEKTLRY